MVNPLKGRILDILHSDSGTVSGELLSDRLGVSRVSVWKHIQKLRELGYDITSGPGGYCLEGDPDAAYPWEFPGRERQIHYFEELPSTMDVARDLARKGCPHFTLVAAGRQTRGRGRLERVWQSARGGSISPWCCGLRFPPAWIYRVNFAASLVLAETLEDRYGLDAKLKWPNDVLVEGKKISGMLSEMEAEPDCRRLRQHRHGHQRQQRSDPDEPGATSVCLTAPPAGFEERAPGRAFSTGWKRRMTGSLDRCRRPLERAHRHLQPAGAHRHRHGTPPKGSPRTWTRTGRWCCA